MKTVRTAGPDAEVARSAGRGPPGRAVILHGGGGGRGHEAKKSVNAGGDFLRRFFVGDGGA